MEVQEVQRSCARHCRARCSSARMRWSSVRSCSRRSPPWSPACGTLCLAVDDPSSRDALGDVAMYALACKVALQHNLF